MKNLQKFCLSLLIVSFTVGISIITLIKGWGLEPKNWWYIIPFYVFGNLTVLLFHEIIKSGIEEK